MTASTPSLVQERGHTWEWGVATALFSEDRVYRYSLTRTWDTALPTTCFLMLNPSTADASVLDRTVRRCAGFAQEWGSGSLLVLNAFALRSTDPLVLYNHDDPVGPLNDEVIRSELARCQPAQVVAGWGTHAARGGRRRDRRGIGLMDVHDRTTDLYELVGPRLLALVVTAAGDPRHPLYLPADTLPLPWSPR